MASGSSPTRHVWLVLLLFAASGCAALIYEITWYQLLQLALGSTAISLGVLLASFMGGADVLPGRDVKLAEDARCVHASAIHRARPSNRSSH